MNTTFKLTTTDASTKQHFLIDLHADILSGKSTDDIMSLATRCAKIDLQNNTKLGLRACESGDDIALILTTKTPFVNATVSPYVPEKTASNDPKVMIAKLKKLGMSDTDIFELITNS